MARAKRSGTSVLSRQKLKTSRSRVAVALKRRRFLIIGVVLILAIGVGVFISKRQARPIPHAPQDWHVTLKTPGDEPLADKAAEQVIATVKRNLGDGSKADLRRAARLAQQTDSYATVHILRTGETGVVIEVMPRQPLLCVEADHLRYVAIDGAIYGALDTPEACPGPVLKGVFPESRMRFPQSEQQTLTLDPEEQAIIHEAVELVQLLKAQSFQVAGLEHRRYRGFFVKLKDGDLEIAVGRTPFVGKLTKLTGILDKLQQKGEQASRIELDYQGKAFIKLKKM